MPSGFQEKTRLRKKIARLESIRNIWGEHYKRALKVNDKVKISTCFLEIEALSEEIRAIEKSLEAPSPAAKPFRKRFT